VRLQGFALLVLLSLHGLRFGGYQILVSWSASYQLNIVFGSDMNSRQSDEDSGIHEQFGAIEVTSYGTDQDDDCQRDKGESLNSLEFHASTQ
jgi:hypothetical protein